MNIYDVYETATLKSDLSLSVESLIEKTETYNKFISSLNRLNNHDYGMESYYYQFGLEDGNSENKPGILKRVWEWIKGIFSKIKALFVKFINWIKGLFSKRSSDKVEEKAKDAAKALKGMDNVDEATSLPILLSHYMVNNPEVIKLLEDSKRNFTEINISLKTTYDGIQTAMNEYNKIGGDNNGGVAELSYPKTKKEREDERNNAKTQREQDNEARTKNINDFKKARGWESDEKYKSAKQSLKELEKISETINLLSKCFTEPTFELFKQFKKEIGYGNNNDTKGVTGAVSGTTKTGKLIDAVKSVNNTVGNIIDNVVGVSRGLIKILPTNHALNTKKTLLDSLEEIKKDKVKEVDKAIIGSLENGKKIAEAIEKLADRLKEDMPKKGNSDVPEFSLATQIFISSSKIVTSYSKLITSIGSAFTSKLDSALNKLINASKKESDKENKKETEKEKTETTENYWY